MCVCVCVCVFRCYVVVVVTTLTPSRVRTSTDEGDALCVAELLVSADDDTAVMTLSLDTDVTVTGMVHALSMPSGTHGSRTRRYAVHVSPRGSPVSGLLFDLNPDVVHPKVRTAIGCRDDVNVNAFDCWFAFVLAGVGTW